MEPSGQAAPLGEGGPMVEGAGPIIPAHTSESFTERT